MSLRTEGPPRGGPPSSPLSNVLLDDLDEELEWRGHLFLRYADDRNVCAKSKVAGRRAMTSLEAFLRERLRLRVNRSRSAVAVRQEVRKPERSGSEGGRRLRSIRSPAVLRRAAGPAGAVHQRESAASRTILLDGVGEVGILSFGDPDNTGSRLGGGWPIWPPASGHPRGEWFPGRPVGPRGVSPAYF